MSRYLNADELHSQGWVAARYINWEPTPLNDNFRLEVEVKPLITFPVADVAEVRHGRWLHLHLDPDNITGHTKGECSICGKLRIVDNYCPNCGAKMDEVTE